MNLIFEFAIFFVFCQSNLSKCFIFKAVELADHSEKQLDDSLIFEEEVCNSIEKKHENKPIKSFIANEKVQRNKFKWVLHSNWESLEEVEDFLDEEGFVCYDYSDLVCGQKFYFRCECIPKECKRSEWCVRRYVIFLPSDCNDICLQCNGLEHNHNKLLDGKKRLISKEMMLFIQELYEKETTKSSSVLKHINSARENQNLSKDESNPSQRQLEYTLKNFRAGKHVLRNVRKRPFSSKNNIKLIIDNI